MALFFIYPLLLMSPFPLSFRNKKTNSGRNMKRRRVRKRAEETGRKEGMMKYGKVHAQGVTLCLPFHCFIIQVPFLWFISSKETEGEKGKRSERRETTRRPFYFSGRVLKRRETRNKETGGSLLYLSSLPSLSLPFPSILQRTRLFLLFADLSPLQEAPSPVFCLLSETTRKTTH